ncbi:hypothetical protein HUS74_28085, partial [Pandoraea nosoerga]|nr:hypothetical protein [Pandoraea nosoerga]
LARGVDPVRIAAFCEDEIVEMVTRTRTAKRQAFKMVTVERAEIVVIDGVPTQKTMQVEEKRPLTDMVAVIDETGRPVMTEQRSPGQSPEDGEPGPEIVTLVPLLH